MATAGCPTFGSAEHRGDARGPPWPATTSIKCRATPLCLFAPRAKSCRASTRSRALRRWQAQDRCEPTIIQNFPWSTTKAGAKKNLCPREYIGDACNLLIGTVPAPKATNYERRPAMAKDTQKSSNPETVNSQNVGRQDRAPRDKELTDEQLRNITGGDGEPPVVVDRT
jgi:hypothetical protein